MEDEGNAPNTYRLDAISSSSILRALLYTSYSSMELGNARVLLQNSESTQEVLRYSRSNQRVLRKYSGSTGTQGVLREYLGSTKGVRYSGSNQGVLRKYSGSTQGVLREYTWSTQEVLREYSGST